MGPTFLDQLACPASEAAGGAALSGFPCVLATVDPNVVWSAVVAAMGVAMLLVVLRMRSVYRRRVAEAWRALEALPESHQLLASITDNLTEAVYRSGPDHQPTFVNAAYLRLFGFHSLEELRAVPRQSVFADPAVWERLKGRLDQAGSYTNEEVEYRRLDGSTFWGLSSALALRDGVECCGNGYVGAITDITAARQATDEIRRLNQTLEQRIAERTAELSASEARLRTLVDHAPEAIVVLDGETGRFVQVNDNATRLFELDQETLLTCTPADLSPTYQPGGGASQDLAREWIDAAMRGEAPVFDWVHAHPSGRPIPCEIRLVRLPGDGRPMIRGSITDNTERRRREAIQQATYQISDALHTTSDLDSLFARIHVIIKSLMKAENFYIALYDRATRLFHFPYFQDQKDSRPAPLKITTGLTGYVIQSGRPLLVNRATPIRRTPTGAVLVLENGDEITYTEAGSPTAVWVGAPLNVRGKTIGVMAVQDYEDETAYDAEAKQILTFIAEQAALAVGRRQAEEELRESEQQFRALFEATSQAVLLHDGKKVLMANQAMLRQYGGPAPATIIGRDPLELSAPVQVGGEPARKVADRYLDQVRTEGSGRFEWIARRADGSQYPVEIFLTPIQMHGRTVFQSVINDITERKRAEAGMLEALAREKELSRLKSRFVSMVSHEFRTPLAIILSSAEILDSYLEQLDPDQRRDHLDSIRKNSRRMSELMEDVLLLGQVEAGRMEVQTAPLRLGDFCQRLLGEIDVTTPERSPVQLQLDPDATEAVGDERLLHHVFLNLLNNAVKYSPAGATVEWSIARDGAMAVSRIRDRGIGIPAEDLKRIFEAFHRGGNVGHLPGTGLGLVIVKRCVELHGGGIRIDSEVGEGTTVTVRLPLFPAAAEPPPQTPVTPEPRAIAPPIHFEV